MIKKILVTLVCTLSINSNVYSNEKCIDFKKYSINYMKCKASSVKNKAASAGKNFINDTKDFQNKEWSDEKKKDQ